VFENLVDDEDNCKKVKELLATVYVTFPNKKLLTLNVYNMVEFNGKLIVK